MTTPSTPATPTARRRRRPLDPIIHNAIAAWMDIDGDLTWFAAMLRAKAEAPKLHERASIQQAERRRQEAMLAAWTHPAGTLVWVRRNGGAEEACFTRSAAWMVSDYASVLLTGISGSYGLEFVRLREEAP